MSGRNDAIESFDESIRGQRCRVLCMTSERERVLCITLTQEEWHAFVTRCPQPVEWLRQQILAHIATQTPADVTGVRLDRTGSSFQARQ